VTSTAEVHRQGEHGPCDACHDNRPEAGPYTIYDRRRLCAGCLAAARQAEADSAAPPDPVTTTAVKAELDRDDLAKAAKAKTKAEKKATKDDAKKTQATLLVELALDPYRVGVSTEGEPFAASKNRLGPALPLRGGKVGLRSQLAARYREKHGSVPTSSALTDALCVLEGMALEQPPEPVFQRVGWRNGGAVLDLGEGALVVVVDATGWRVEAESPVLFRSTALTAPLPQPERGGDLDDLWPFVNVADESQPLLAAWLVSILLDGSHPIVGLLGLQGTGKTTAARYLASVLDPSTAAVRAAPRDLDGWAVAASGSHVVPIDNVSAMAVWFSDALCRASTGEGIVKRKLYTDAELAVIAFRRPVILTSIDPGALRGDLGERLLAIDTEPISGRRTDDDLAHAWEKAHPRILGAILDLAVEVFKVLPGIPDTDLPRMADYGRVLAAVDLVLGTNGAYTYRGMANRIAEDVIESDQVATALRTLGSHDGTMGELLDKLNAARGTKQAPQGWPKTPRALRGNLNRVIPALRQLGHQIEFKRDGDGTRKVLIEAPQGDGFDGSDGLDGGSHSLSESEPAESGESSKIGSGKHRFDRRNRRDDPVQLPLDDLDAAGENVREVFPDAEELP
jgi:hypothetical protein